MVYKKVLIRKIFKTEIKIKNEKKKIKKRITNSTTRCKKSIVFYEQTRIN